MFPNIDTSVIGISFLLFAGISKLYADGGVLKPNFLLLIIKNDKFMSLLFVIVIVVELASTE